MSKQIEKNYSLEKYHTKDYTITEVLLDMVKAQAFKDDEREAKDKYTAHSTSLSAKFMVLSKMAVSLEDYELMVKESRRRIKEGALGEGSKAVPQAFYDASSICRKGWKLGTLSKADSVESLKKLNSAALKAQSAENPTGFDDFIHLLRDSFKAAEPAEGEEESPVQTAMLADLKALATKYTEAAATATGDKKPTPRKAAKTTKAAAK